MWHGNIALGDTIDIKFTTVTAAGVPSTLSGTPVVSAYPGNSTTQLTAGITLSVDFDAVTGLNNVRVVATGGNGYAAGNYTLVITTGTVDSVSVVGYVVGSFSIDSRSVAGVQGNVTGSVASVTGNVGGVAGTITTLDALDTAQDTQHSTTQSAITALNDLSAAQVNAEVLDVLTVDTFAEPAAVPAATASLKDKLGWLAALARNKITQTATTTTLRDDADSSSIATSTTSDDGTTATRSEWT